MRISYRTSNYQKFMLENGWREWVVLKRDDVRGIGIWIITVEKYLIICLSIIGISVYFHIYFKDILENPTVRLKQIFEIPYSGIDTAAWLHLETLTMSLSVPKNQTSNPILPRNLRLPDFDLKLEQFPGFYWIISHYTFVNIYLRLPLKLQWNTCMGIITLSASHLYAHSVPPPHVNSGGWGLAAMAWV